MTLKTVDKNGEIIQAGDMVRIHERYNDWPGIVKEVFWSRMFSVQPISWQSSPHFLIPAKVTKVDVAEVEEEFLR